PESRPKGRPGPGGLGAPHRISAITPRFICGNGVAKFGRNRSYERANLRAFYGKSARASSSKKTPELLGACGTVFGLPGKGLEDDRVELATDFRVARARWWHFRFTDFLKNGKIGFAIEKPLESEHL